MAVLLFVRNLVNMLSIYEDSQKETIQEEIVKELSRRDPSPAHLRQVIEQLESFLSHSTIMEALQHQLDSQKDSANDLARSVEAFLRDARTSEQERDRLIVRFGQETLSTLNSGTDVADMVRKLRVLVTDMLQHYREQALSWEQRARELERMVNVDPLLAPLHNRRALDDQLRAAVAKAEAQGSPLSVFMIDVDNFKTTINDVYGHQVGDDVLRTLAKIISGYASKNDWFAARYGGDELVLVCELDADEAQFYAEAVRLAVQQYEFKPRISGKLLDKSIRFTISIGVAEYHSGMGWQDLLGAADDAMYQVKGTGKNNVIRYRCEPPAS
jgi:diguanylate cyclase (GGDEF)-like protein